MSRARTKQVCTIGPASFEKIPQLVGAGMDVARINFSHGSADDHRAYVHAVRAAAHSARRSVAVMADLPGPKVRLGELADGEARLQAGSTFVLRAEDGTPGDASGAAVAHPEVLARLQPDDRVLLADGAAELRVVSVDGSTVTTEVVIGGLVRSHGGVNVPSVRLAQGGLTDEDRAAVPRALELRVDLIAQSFVCSADDVRALRALLPADGPRVVVKVETRAAVDAFDAIVAEADGVMVARGDLGVDLPYEAVPLVQKDLIARSVEAGKFVIVATQMLESMTGAPRPTRAEASDVANAVLDGADAVMLSAETAIGSFPVESLEAMERICEKVETDGGDLLHGAAFLAGNSPADAIIVAATYVALRGGEGCADAIWCFTRSGRTAELLSLQRPGIPIVAFTLSPIVARRLAVRSGVVPVVLSASAKSGSLVERMEQAWRSQHSGHEHSTVLLVTTSQQSSGINRLEIHAIAPPPAPARPQGQPARASGDRARQQGNGVPRQDAPRPAEPDQPPDVAAEPDQPPDVAAEPDQPPAVATEPDQPPAVATEPDQPPAAATDPTEQRDTV